MVLSARCVTGCGLSNSISYVKIVMLLFFVDCSLLKKWHKEKGKKENSSAAYSADWVALLAKMVTCAEDDARTIREKLFVLANFSKESGQLQAAVAYMFRTTLGRCMCIASRL